MHFVDDVNLVAAGSRPVSNGFPQGPYVVDAGVARGVDFDEIQEALAPHAETVSAAVAGLRLNALEAVNRSGKNAGNRGLTGAPIAGKHIRVIHPVVSERVLKNSDHMALTNNVAELLRPVFVV